MTLSRTLTAIALTTALTLMAFVISLPASTREASGKTAVDCDISFRSFCYSVERGGPRTFMQAERFCVSQYGGHLASIHSQPENDVVGHMVDPAGAGKITAWIGAVAPSGFTARAEGNYRWSDGSPWTFQRWRRTTSEPNATPGDAPAGVQFWPDSNGRLSGWNDIPQSATQNNLVCKYRSPEAAAASPYKMYGNRKFAGFPWFDPQTNTLTLTPVDAYGASAAAFLKEPVPVPFVLLFEFNIWDEDGGRGRSKRWNSANGISVIFAKDDSIYRQMPPPAGSGMGFFSDGSSLGIFLKTYGNRQVILDNGYQTLAIQKERAVYTRGEWQKARVEVNADSIIVKFDDRTVIEWEGDVPFAIPYVVFAAATGGANSRHQIRNVVFQR
ncbi:MAG: hypothetical protein IH996_09725 [Proteobacteria bacterium]|nr:hypothetical protein [Pseudomonadota bacterium]